jgi:RNase P subunit RPR2
MAYANSLCGHCDTIYWYGSTDSIRDELDFDNTVGKICCPNCNSIDRKPWPGNIRLGLLTSIRRQGEDRNARRNG